MHTIEIPSEKLVLYLPSELSECDSQQYIDMAELILRYQSEQITFDEFKVHAVYKLLNLRPEKEKKRELTEEEKIDEYQKFVNVSVLSNKIESFFEKNGDNQNVIKQNYLNNPVPSIKFWKTYYGPYDNFQNITFKEYTDALRLYHDFATHMDVEILYLIAAIFYRPKKVFHSIRKHLNNYDGDNRIAYNSNRIEARAKKFKYLPMGFVFGVYLYFASYQKFISTGTINWGDREIDLSILFSSDGEENTTEDRPGIGMDSIMFSLIESGALGNKKETMNANNWEVLIRMYDIRLRDIEQKKQMKRNDQSTEN